MHVLKRQNVRPLRAGSFCLTRFERKSTPCMRDYKLPDILFSL